SSFVSGSEVAFFSLAPEDLRNLQSNPDEKSHLVIKLVETPQKLLSTILILNNVLNISLITLATYMTCTLFGGEPIVMVMILIEIAIVVFLLVFVGEVIPRAYANNHRIPFTKLMAPSLYAFSIILSPFSSILLSISNVIERKIEKKGYSLSVNELHRALEITSENTTMEEKDILKGIVNFGTLTVKQVMQSRMDLTAVDIKMDFHELMDKINKSGYSRIPVYNETIDYIEGILYIKDLLSHIDKDEDFEWQTL